MRFLITAKFPNDHGNKVTADPQFGEKIQRLIADMKPEAVYFGPVEGKRAFRIFVNFDDPSLIPAYAEPLFRWLHADVEISPVFNLEDMKKAGPSILDSVKKWSS